jgi:uncharacterized membrane protein YtjA (UPF0391 family)
LPAFVDRFGPAIGAQKNVHGRGKSCHCRKREAIARPNIAWAQRMLDRASLANRRGTLPGSARERIVRRRVFKQIRRPHMLGWAIFFLIVALVAAVLGFGGVAAISVEFAKIIFWVFLVLFALSLVYSLVTGRRPPAP